MSRVDIRIILENELADKFLLIKKRKGIKHNTEVIRLLVNEKFEQLAKKQEEAVA